MEKQKRPRESTDLEEYVVLVPKNIVELQAVAKLSPSKIWKKSSQIPSKLFFFGKCNNPWISCKHMVRISELPLSAQTTEAPHQVVLYTRQYLVSKQIYKAVELLCARSNKAVKCLISCIHQQLLLKPNVDQV